MLLSLHDTSGTICLIDFSSVESVNRYGRFNAALGTTSETTEIRFQSGHISYIKETPEEIFTALQPITRAGANPEAFKSFCDFRNLGQPKTTNP